MLWRIGVRFIHKASTKKVTPVFKNGKFSQLAPPAKDVIIRSNKGADQILLFEQLKIFPLVRQAMEHEIRNAYTLKSTYIKSKDALVLKPSPIQVAAVRSIQLRRQPPKLSISEQIQQELRGPLQVYTMAAETGSGKTWAYLLCVLSKLLDHDYKLFMNGGPEALQHEYAQPVIRLVILVPTNELVDQVYASLATANECIIDQMKVPKQYQEFTDHQPTLGLSLFKWGAGVPHTKMFSRLQKKGRIDVLVTTPSKITGLSKLTNVNRPFKYFSQVRYCVADEADTLFDRLWSQDTTNVVTHMHNLEMLVLCSATIPKSFKESLTKIFPNQKSIVEIATPTLHKLPSKIHVKVIDASLAPFNNSKPRALAQTLYAITKEGSEGGFVKRVVVFVNEKKQVPHLVGLLTDKFAVRRQDIAAATGDMSPSERAEVLAPFIRPTTPLEQDPDGSKIKILVTTDLMARGINFSGIKNVVMLDVPLSLVDLVHRMGRTGRMNQSGRVFVIMDLKSSNKWAKGLPKMVKNGVVIG